MASFLFVSIFLVPIMELSAIQFGIQQIRNDNKIKVLRNAVFFQSPLMLWWVINNTAIYTSNLTSYPAIILMETLYGLIMMWFFIVILLKSIQIKKFSMILNPLVLISSFLIIGTIFLVI